MEYSKEQEDIFKFATTNIKNLIVQAVAGAGKTTTLIECVRRIGKDKKILLLAYNKSVRDTLVDRLGDDKGDKTMIFTLHGLGWRILQENTGKTPMLNDEKYKNYIRENLNALTDETYKSLSAANRTLYKNNVYELVNKARQNLKQSEKEIKKLAVKKYAMKLVGDEPRVVSEILKWGSENIQEVDFLDLIWLPYEHNYWTKRYTAEIILLDEAQDISVAQEDLISRCFRRETRLIAFGDKDQMINTWAGSDNESFENLKDPDKFRRDAGELSLSTNYRCGKKIIEFAKQYTDNGIHAKEDAEEGEVNLLASFNDIKDGDLVLCRNEAPLMTAYTKGISQGKKMYFRGSNVESSIKKFLQYIDGDTVDMIKTNLKRSIITLWERTAKENDVDLKEAADDRQIIEFLDVLNTLEAIPSSIKSRDILESFIDDVFSEDEREGIELSTIHKAKGLEADNVFIICPSLIPSKLAKTDWQIEEEKHLQYVMCTRPKKSLNFVSEKEIKPNAAFLGKISLYNELKKIKEELDEQEK